MKLKILIGSGDKIMLLTLPFLIVGLILNFLYPKVFAMGGPSVILIIISWIILIPGIIVWFWSVFLIITKVPKGKLITDGPYFLVKHPLYTGVSLLVIPWAGFLLNSWLGVVIGLILYTASKIYSKHEEELLFNSFGNGWNDYLRKVKVPWL